MSDTELANSQIGLNLLLGLCLECHAVGSRVTCDPPVMDTDRDMLCLVKDRFMVATRLAKRFNLQAKADRVALFQAVLYGNG